MESMEKLDSDEMDFPYLSANIHRAREEKGSVLSVV